MSWAGRARGRSREGVASSASDVGADRGDEFPRACGGGGCLAHEPRRRERLCAAAVLSQKCLRSAVCEIKLSLGPHEAEQEQSECLAVKVGGQRRVLPHTPQTP